LMSDDDVDELVRERWTRLRRRREMTRDDSGNARPSRNRLGRSASYLGYRRSPRCRHAYRFQTGGYLRRTAIQRCGIVSSDMPRSYLDAYSTIGSDSEI
jgi:hypothetical protein